MDSDSTPLTPPEGEARAAALAEEVRQLRRLLLELQSELRPAVQSSLRERSDELQRLGGEVAVREEELERLKADLKTARRRSLELEQEVERWKGAARRGLDELQEKARAAADRFEQQTEELTEALAAVRSQLEASRAQARSITQARDAALMEVERRTTRIRSLRARLLKREVRRIEMMRSLSWRITAPLRWFPKAFHRFLVETARMRRRIFGR